MSFETVLVAVLVGIALIIVVVNDLWKRGLVEKSRSQNKNGNPDWQNNKTQWSMVVALIAGAGLYIYLLNHPELTAGDFGPFTPWVRHLFDKPNFDHTL